MGKGSKIYDFFEKWGKVVVKFRWLAIILVIVVIAAASLGLGNLKMSSKVSDWFSKRSIVNKNKEKFESIFKNSEYVGLLIKADNVFSYDILSMIKDLGEDITNDVPLVNKIISLTETEFSYADESTIYIEKIIPDAIPESEEDLNNIRDRVLTKKYLKNRIVSDDSKETWLIVQLDPFPEDWGEHYSKDPDSVIAEEVYKIINNEKYSRYTILATGNPIWLTDELVLTTEESNWMLTALIILTIIFLVLFLRSIRGIIVPFLSITFAIVMVFGIMGIFDISLNAFLVMIPLYLTVAVSIGYSIHIFNYFNREFNYTGNRKQAVISAVRQSGYPILFTALTTIGALLSFLTVGLIPVQWLGYTCASCVLAVYLVLFTFVPAVLSLGKDKKAKGDGDKPVEIKSDKYFEKLCNWTLAHNKLVLVICSVIAIGFAVGIFWFKVNFNTEQSYGPRVPYINRMKEIGNAKVGAFGSYNITIDLGESDAAKEFDNLSQFEKFTKKIEELKLTKRTTSLLSYLKDMNQLLNGDNEDYYRIPDTTEMISQTLFLYEMSGGELLNEYVNDDYSILRLQVDTNDLDSIEALEEINLINEYAGELFPGAKHNITGAILEYAVLNQFVATGQVVTFLIALLVIAFLMMIIFGSVKAGLIGLLPNITPAIVIGGLMGFLNIPLDFMTMTIIPIILGIAVDDTIHFITHLRYEIEFENISDYIKASIKTMRVVGKAICMTTCIIVVPFLTFVFSKFNFLVNLGLFLAIGLAVALLADIFITPVLLYLFKPFGKKKLHA
ncbi:MAG: MMPL family transporter [Spirochaetales bacterium]|nr:MMPL family transporter [Spirochaetales bacterium]